MVLSVLDVSGEQFKLILSFVFEMKFIVVLVGVSDLRLKMKFIVRRM